MVNNVVPELWQLNLSSVTANPVDGGLSDRAASATSAPRR